MSIPRTDTQFIGLIAKKLKTIREAHGLSQMRVLMDTGINVSRLESGKRNPSLYSIAILCAYFGVRLEEFFRGIELKNHPWE